MIEGEFPVIDGPTNHVLVIGMVGIDDRPVVDAVPFCSDSAGATAPLAGSASFSISNANRSPIGWVDNVSNSEN